MAERTVVLRLLAPVVLLAACANAPAGASAGNETSATAAAQPSAASPSPQHGELGRSGSTAWLITPQGLSLSEDAGRTFAQVPLPATVAPTAIAAVTVVPGKTWLASVGPGRSVTVFARVSGSWSPGVQLTPDWPANMGGDETHPPSAVSILPSAGNQVVVMTQLALSHSVSIPRIFVSEDGGRTFAQRVLPEVSDFNTRWNAIAMSGTNAVAVIGERQNEVIHSGDGGSTWAPSTVHADASATDFVAGTPVFAGATIYLPVSESDSTNDGAFVLLRSTDGGAVFESRGAQTLPLGALAVTAPLPVTAAGATWWLVSPMTGSVYRSTDSGLTWSMAGAALPQGVIDVAATDSQNAAVTITHHTCATGKTDCSSDQYSETTSDGGQTWTRSSP